MPRSSPLVVALNPSVDVEWTVRSVRWGEKNEVLAERRWPGGKGVNVARWLRHLGPRPRLLLPLGGRHGDELAAGLKAEGLSTIILPIRQESRANVIVTGAPEGQLRFNPAGPTLSAAEWRRLKQLLRNALADASLLILAGSLPPGLAPDAYHELITIARRAGVRTVLDCDGPALAASLSAGPFLVKPNHHELAHWLNRPLVQDADVREGTLALARKTRGWVLTSTGPDGGWLAHATPPGGKVALFRAQPPAVRALNTVGAGDALVAAVVVAIDNQAPPAEWLRRGLAAGSAATTQPAGVLPSPTRIQTLLRAVNLMPSSPEQ